MTNTRTYMKTLTLLVVAGFVTGFLVVGIVQAAQSGQASGKSRSVIVPLLLNTNDEVTGIGQPFSDDATSNGKEVGLSKKQNHHAEWVTNPSSADVSLTIGMKANDPYPFDGAFKIKGNTVSSAKLLKDAKEGKYDYWVKVHDNKTGKDFKIDPPIRVDP